MKQKDFLLIAVVIIFSATLSILLSSTFISSPKHRSQEVEVVEPIVADFPEPDKRYFNEKSVDPTQLIRIGNNSNPKPFKAPPEEQ